MAMLYTSDGGQISSNTTETKTIIMPGSGNSWIFTAKLWRTTVHTLKTCIVHNMLGNVNCGFATLLNTNYSTGVITFKTQNDGGHGGYNANSGNKILIEYNNNHNEYENWYWAYTPLHFT